MKIFSKIGVLVLGVALLISAMPVGAEPLTDDTDMNAFLYDTFTLENANSISSIPAENGEWTIADTKGSNPWNFLKSEVSNGVFTVGGIKNSYYGISATRSIVTPAEVDASSKKYVIKFDLKLNVPDLYEGNENIGQAIVAVNGTAGSKNQPAAELIYSGTEAKRGKLWAVAGGSETVLLENFDSTAACEVKIELDFNTGLCTYTIGGTRKALAMAYSNAASFSGELSQFVLNAPPTKPSYGLAQISVDNLRIGTAIEQDSSLQVTEDLAALSIGDVRAVEHSFVLPSLGSVHNSVVTWESKHDSIEITNVRGVSNQYQACVTRPGSSAEDTVGQLIATVTNDGVSDTRSFDVTVKALASSEYYECVIDDNFSGEYLNPTDAEMANAAPPNLTTYVPAELDHWLFVGQNQRSSGQHGFRVHEDGYLQLGHNVEDNCYVEAKRTISLTEHPLVNVDFRIQFAPTIPAGGEATHDMRLDLTLMLPKNSGGEGNITLRYTASERSVVIPGDKNPILTDVDSTAWYAFRMELNYEKHCYHVYVNGEKRATKELDAAYRAPNGFSMVMERFKNASGAYMSISGLVGMDDFKVTAAKTLSAADMAALDAFDGLVTADYLILPKTGNYSESDYTWSCESDGLLTIKEIDGVVYGMWDKSKLTGDTAQVTLRAAIGETSRDLTVTVQKSQGLAYLICVKDGTVQAIQMEKQAKTANLFVAKYEEGRLISVTRTQTQAASIGEPAASLQVNAAEGEIRAFILGADSLSPLGKAW